MLGTALRRAATTCFKHNVRRQAMATAAATGNKRKAAHIGTHSGTFHCDEALGCFMLKQTQQFADCDIVRCG